jgi:hypothetical protein
MKTSKLAFATCALLGAVMTATAPVHAADQPSNALNARNERLEKELAVARGCPVKALDAFEKALTATAHPDDLDIKIAKLSGQIEINKCLQEIMNIELGSLTPSP